MVEPELFGHSQRSLWQTFLLWPSLTEGCLLGAHFMRDPRSDAGNCSHGWLVVSSGNKLQVTARSIPPRENWMLQEPTSEFETTSHRWAVAAANITRDRLPLGSWWPSGDQQKPAQQSKCSCAKTGAGHCELDVFYAHLIFDTSRINLPWKWTGHDWARFSQKGVTTEHQKRHTTDSNKFIEFPPINIKTEAPPFEIHQLTGA